MARIYRDAYGVPHVRAASVLDLAHGQGWVTARDRAWQLEYLRRRATGTTAEILGGRLPDWDVLARRTRMADTARRAFANLGDESQAFVAAYVEGVNAGLHARRARADRARASSPSAGSPGRRWPCSTPSTCSSPRCPTSSGSSGPAAVLGDDARFLARDGAADRRQQRVGGRRAADGERPPADRRGPAPGDRVARRLPAGAAGLRGPEGTGDAFDVAGLHVPRRARRPALRARRRGRVGDHQRDARTTRTSPRSPWTTSSRPAEEVIAVRGAEPMTVEVAATVRGPLFEIDRDRGRRPQPPRRRRRSWATSASRRCSRCCARAPSTTSTRRSTPGSSRATTS